MAPRLAQALDDALDEDEATNADERDEERDRHEKRDERDDSIQLQRSRANPWRSSRSSSCDRLPTPRSSWRRAVWTLR